MVKVEMPRGNWDTVLMLLEESQKEHKYFLAPLIKEIEDQVYSQEY